MTALKSNRAGLGKTSLVHYQRRELELTSEDGILAWGNRVVVPKSLRRYVLKELHKGHLGIGKMKAIARPRMWWPNMDRDIEGVTYECDQCLMNRDSPQRSPLIPWPAPQGEWYRVHLDYLGPLSGYYLLVIIDAKSKWVEAFVGKTPTTKHVLSCLRQVFSRFGLPNQLVTDNGTCFTSAEFGKFMREQGIDHRRTAPGHPSTNGQAENAVKTLKRALKKHLNGRVVEEEALEALVNETLQWWRNAPNRATGKSPAEAMLGRRLRSKLDLLLPEAKLAEQETTQGPRDQQYRDKMVRGYAGKRNVELPEGSAVLVRDFSNPNRQGWLHAVVMEKLGYRHYMCKLANGRLRKCNVEQIILRKEMPETIEARLSGATPVEPADHGRQQGSTETRKVDRRLLLWVEPQGTVTTIDSTPDVQEPVGNDEEPYTEQIEDDGESSSVRRTSESDFESASENGNDPNVISDGESTELSSVPTKHEAANTTSSGPCPMCGGNLRETEMVLCSKCKCWLHYECVGVGDSIAECEPWECPMCLGFLTSRDDEASPFNPQGTSTPTGRESN